MSAGTPLDPRTITSRWLALAAHERGELEPLLLVPPALGGSDDPSNVVYVPNGTADVKSVFDEGVVVPLMQDEPGLRYSAEPGYVEDSVVPASLRLSVRDDEEIVRVRNTVHVWSRPDALLESGAVGGVRRGPATATADVDDGDGGLRFAPEEPAPKPHGTVAVTPARAPPPKLVDDSPRAPERAGISRRSLYTTTCALQITNGVLSVIGGIASVLFGGLGTVGAVWNDGPGAGLAVGLAAFAIMRLGVGVVQVLAGVHNLDFRSRTLGIVAAVVGAFVNPCSLACLPLGVATAVLALVVLLDTDVTEAFRRRESGESADAVRRWLREAARTRPRSI